MAHSALRRHTHCRPSRRTFRAPIDRSARVLGNLDRGRLAAGIDDLRPAPLRDLTARRLTVMRGKAKPTATLQVTAQRYAPPPVVM
jgi:hypothetical protein